MVHPIPKKILFKKLESGNHESNTIKQQELTVLINDTRDVNTTN